MSRRKPRMRFKILAEERLVGKVYLVGDLLYGEVR